MNTPEIGQLAFRGQWRHYQALALEAFEADRRNGARSTYILAPPGSGKTLLGVEIVRRLGARALVLTPNSAVQAQWLLAAGEFGAPAGFAAADPSAPLACLTYQALCQLDDPATALNDLAQRRWAADRAQHGGSRRHGHGERAGHGLRDELAPDLGLAVRWPIRGRARRVPPAGRADQRASAALAILKDLQHPDADKLRAKPVTLMC